MVRVGLVGIGFMGLVHFRAYQQVRGARVVAISTRDAKKLAGDWRDIKGNFGPPGEVIDLTDIAAYDNWQELIHDPEIDLIDICLPPALHAAVTIAALAAGKHVLVEKPIAVDLAEARAMVAAARRSDRQLMVAHVLPFHAEYHYLRQLIEDGKYGRLLGGHFQRIISEPSWIPDFFDPQTVGGPLVDLHIHDAHFIRLVAGQPAALFTTARWRGEVVEFFETQFLYPDNQLMLTARGGVIGQQGRSFTHGCEIYLEQATVGFDFSVTADQPTMHRPLTLLGPRGKVQQPKLPPVDAFVAELTAAVRAVAKNERSPLLSAELALDALTLCHQQTKSARAGRVVKCPKAP